MNSRKNVFYIIVLLLGSYSSFGFSATSFTPSRTPDPITYSPYTDYQIDYNVTVGGHTDYVLGYLPKNRLGILRNRPLVMIMHGQGSGSGFGDGNYFKKMAQHLAQNGFAVVRPDWQTGQYAAANHASQMTYAKDVLRENLDRVYSLYGQYLSNDVVLIGHSVGGGVSIRYANVVNGHTIGNRKLSLKSIVALAPSPKIPDMRETRRLQSVSDSLLVIIPHGDRDIWGEKDADTNLMATGIKLYDDTGIEWYTSSNNAKTFPEKDLMFIYKKGKHQGTYGHSSLANDANINGYINAYLRLHLYNDSRYQKYFKYRYKPESLESSLGIVQSHADRYKLPVANFSKKSSRYFYGGSSTAQGRIYTARSNGVGEIVLGADNSWKSDQYSPHDTQVLNVSWDRQGNSGFSALRFRYYSNKKKDLRNYNYLSFRLTQVSNGSGNSDYYNPNGNPLDFKLRLFNNNGTYSNSIWVSEFEQEVSYPIRQKLRVGVDHLREDVTKHIMQTVMIPLSAFDWSSGGGDFNFNGVRELKFYFYGKGRISIDNIEYLQ